MIKLKNIIEDIQKETDAKEYPLSEQLKLTRLQENEALQYIKRVLLPAIVNKWNRRLVPTLDLDELNKELKKIDAGVDYMKTRDLDTAESIRIPYEYAIYVTYSPANNRIRFVFTIHKTISGKVQVKTKTLKGVDVSPIYVGREPMIFENIQTEPNSDNHTISKLEEYEALDFIKKTIIPIALNSYNQYSDNSYFEPISITDILKNLKKVDVDFPHIKIKNPTVTSSVYNPTIFYEANIGNLRKWKFTISKQLEDSKIYVMWQHPFNFGGRRYYVGGNVIEQNLHMKIQEVDNTKVVDRSISKESEMRGLQYIRRVVIPDFVEDWNKKYKKKIKEQDVNRNLIKKEQIVWPLGSNLMDYVEYEYITPLKSGIVSFKIIKNREGELGVTYNIVIAGESDRGFIGGMYTIRRGDLKENKNLVENIEELSRKEELYALNFLQRKLMPTVLDEKYTWYLKKYPARYPERKYPHITEKDINTNLKKVRYDIESAHYESIIDDEVFFDFHIVKRDGIMVIGALGPMNTDWSWYKVDGAFDLRESVNTQTYAVSKLEEYYTVNFIKRDLIPKLVEFINDVNHHYTRHPQITVQDVTKTLKKIAEYRHSTGYIRELTYQALILGEPFEFDIFKDAEYRLKVLQKSDATQHTVTTKK